MGFVANFICFPAAQTFWKSVKKRQSNREFKGGNFFETQCMYVFCFCLYTWLSVFSGGARPGRARSNDLAERLPPWLPPWLSFFYSAAALLAMQSAVIPTAIPSVHPCVCPFVCPSVTRWYPIQTNEHRITRSSLWGSKNTLVFWHQQWLGATSPST